MKASSFMRICQFPQNRNELFPWNSAFLATQSPTELDKLNLLDRNTIFILGKFVIRMNESSFHSYAMVRWYPTKVCGETIVTSLAFRRDSIIQIESTLKSRIYRNYVNIFSISCIEINRISPRESRILLVEWAQCLLWQVDAINRFIAVMCYEEQIRKSS